MDCEDDYKSDECDEHTATELFLNAFFKEQSIPVSCEAYVKSRRSFTGMVVDEPSETCGEPVAASTTIPSGKPGPVLEAAAAIDVVGTRRAPGDIESLADSYIDGSDNEGIATKLEVQKVKPRKTAKADGRPADNPGPSVSSSLECNRSDESGDSDDINANIRPRPKRAKKSRTRAERNKKTDVISVQESPTKATPVNIENSDDGCEISTALPTLSPEFTSDEEISLSDPEDMELNVVSFGRGIPDQVTMKKKLSPEEHKRLWHVDMDDKFRHLRRNRYHTSKECRNCRQSGHLTHECPLPERIVCILCADTTHIAARCPNKICSTCKNEGHTWWRCYRAQHLLETQCRICNIFGHKADICPDNWRRFHCTTREGPPIAPEAGEKLSLAKKFCSWCGRRGHFATDCGRAANSGIASRFVHSYKEPRTSARNPQNKKKRKKKQESASEHAQTSQAERGRASVLGGDFIPISEASKKFNGFPNSSRAGVSSGSEKNDGSKRSRKSGDRKRGQHPKKKRKLYEPDLEGIDMFPSVRKQKRKRAAESDDSVPLNRRKERRRERRKLLRMQSREERDKSKKKKLKRSRGES
ncbi:zinc finger CCHC domain-containing protein 7 [Galendromus occidentalis]|uniref:Zinc finger CCHC domain-containing protein 7 n=1 Tax=Galendromus occidentalis TaxID=34638 RepID=A0AAJ6VYJ2_9ACAR|nr:zinc finger CCHC domain-containing protein 7 [Galendromus occidentalis]